MTLVDLLHELANRGISIGADGGQLRMSAPKGVLTPDLQLRLRENKEALLALLSASDAAPAPDDPILESAPGTPAPLSAAQYRLWFTEQLKPGTAAQNLPFPLRLNGLLDVEALGWVVREIGRRHDVLRSRIAVIDDVPMHVLVSEVLTLAEIDLTDLPAAEREAHARAGAAADAAQPFDLEQAPLIRFTLWRMSPTSHWLQVVSHHVVFDGWSHDVLFRELRELYEARTSGSPMPPAPPVRFVDFIRWHEAWLEQPQQSAQLVYWTDRLAGMPTVLEMPTDFQRPSELSGSAISRIWTLESELVQRLRGLALANGATLNMVALASLELLLWRYSGQRDFAIGMPSRGRVRPEAEELIGMFVNTLAVRSDLAASVTFRDLLRHVRDSSIDALSHQDVPFDRLVQAIQPVREKNRTPLLQVMYSFQEASRRQYRMGELDIEQIPLFSGATATDATFWIRDHRDYAVGVVELAADLFTVTTAERWLRSWKQILESIAKDPDQSLSTIPVIAPEDSQALQASHRVADGERIALVHQMIERCAHEHPDRPALHFENRSLTFAELDRRANQYANVLVQRGVKRDTLVGVCLPRGLDLIVAMLGVMKAGAGYVPLDPGYPSERLELFVADSQAGVVISTGSLSARLDLGSSLLLIDRDAQLIAAARETAPDVIHNAAQLAYVIYTSGSTGRPKAVMVEHRNVMNLFAALRAEIGLGDDGIWMAGGSMSFDISIPETWGCLCHGRPVVIVGDMVLGDARAPEFGLAAQARRHGVTHFQCTPSQSRILLLNPETRSMLAQLKQLIVAGEALPQDLSDILCRLVAGGEVINGYGPTEVTVYSAMGRMRDGVPVTIGRAIPSVHGFIVDERGQPVPWGSVGELWLGGESVTRGYLARPELTDERFVCNPFAPTGGDRVYRSGDLVRLDAEGRMVYLGRNDNQVKIRGYRLELGEIESTIVQVPGISGVVVTAFGVGEAKRLIAYLTTTPAFTGERELRAQLKLSLPEFMVPSSYVLIDAFPLTPSGKIDRKALPDPGAIDMQDEYVAPETETQRILCEIWSTGLSVPRVGITDDFFALGGHSLLAVRIFNDIVKACGIRLPLTSLFDGPTVAQLAARIDLQHGNSSSVSAEWSTVVPIKPTGSLPPFFCAAGIGGSPMNLVHLAAELDPEQPFYGLQHRGIDGKLAPHETIRSMAEEFLTHIRMVQPHGPYYVGGYSMGGVVAYEMAILLREQGEDVGLVVLLDTQAPTLPHWTMRERFMAHWGRLQKEGPAYLWRRSVQFSVRQITHAKTWFNLTLSSKDTFSLRHDLVQDAGHKALRRYVPGQYSGDVLLLRAQMRLKSTDGIGYRMHESNGWRGYVTGKLRIEQIGMQHLEMVTAAAAPSTAEPIAEALAIAYAQRGVSPRRPRVHIAPALV